MMEQKDERVFLGGGCRSGTRAAAAEAGGFRAAMDAGLDIVAPLYAAKTEVGMKFQEIKAKDGFGVALEWRSGQFKE